MSISGTAKNITGTTIPASFSSRKRKILADLSVPDAEYTDLSPKGSIDEGIRDLIRDINGLEGLVTTSSCAGRVSVFLEGPKKKSKKQAQDAFLSEVRKNDDENHDDEGDEDDAEQHERRGAQFASAGGKGGGRWLYVSHDPVTVPARDAEGRSSLHGLFGMVPGDGKPMKKHDDDDFQGLRLVRFQFEPMILHIMTATLKHAQPVLTAAFSAGFRESGLQSLRCLDDDDTNGKDASPIIVAVRSSGLSLESIIGYYDEDSGDGEPIIRSLVTEEYLRMLVGIANERFEVNAERVKRFRTKLLELFSAPQAADSGSRGKGKGKVKSRPEGWEDPEARRERKRAEGLRRKEELEARRHEEERGVHDTHDNDDDGFQPLWEVPS